MKPRFYAAWGIAVLLALVVPLAVPYTVWVPGEASGHSAHASCVNHAKYNVVQNNRVAINLLALDVSVDACSGTAGEWDTYDAGIVARGAYGIPYASGRVTAADTQFLSPTGGLVLNVIALLVGAFAVSLPFLFVAAQRRARDLQFAT